MANTRTFDEVNEMTFNSIVVEGLKSLEIREGHRVNADSEQDGVHGPDDVASAHQFVEGSLATDDILDLIGLLISTPGTATWKGRKSGSANWGQGTLTAPVPHGLSFSADQGGFGRGNLNFTCRFASAGATFADVVKWDEGGIAAPAAFPTPSRLWRPNTLAHGSLNVNHLVDLSFNLSGRVLTDADGNDIGETAVDVAGYAVPTVTITIRYSQEIAADTKKDMKTALVTNGIANLTVAFVGVGNAVPKTLTIRNVKFDEARKTTGRNWTGHTLTGRCQWRDPLAPFTQRTINDATPANRLINFA
ncbi:MAG: hypothetical protein AABZ47_13365 [Planctomycetota bacterium]